MVPASVLSRGYVTLFLVIAFLSAIGAEGRSQTNFASLNKRTTVSANWRPAGSIVTRKAKQMYYHYRSACSTVLA